MNKTSGTKNKTNPLDMTLGEINAELRLHTENWWAMTDCRKRRKNKLRAVKEVLERRKMRIMKEYASFFDNDDHNKDKDLLE